MPEIAERNKWYKDKQPIMAEFSGSHRALMSGIASRNFTHPPGYLFEASIALEEVGKNKLSALNYSIVAEAIERELKQTGHDYSQAYKTACIAFELEKQSLLTALQQEFADLDATQSLTEEELNRLFVELDLRKLLLITTKTTIDLQIEGLKQQLIDTDRLTYTQEENLINEKVITATKKLEVIPYIAAIIEAQGKLLIAEEENIPYMEELIDEKELLIDKKEEIIPYLEDRATEQLLLAEALTEQINFKEQMLGVALDKILLREDIVDNKIDILDAEILVEDMRQLLADKRHDLQEDKLDNGISLLDEDNINLGLIQTEQTRVFDILQTDLGQIQTDDHGAEKDVLDEDIVQIEASEGITVAAKKLKIQLVAGAQAEAIKEKADAAAAAKITSELIHLIGS